MACPYFFPVNPRTEGTNPQHAMLPLGATWTGSCRALPDRECQPDESVVHSLCNLGYARGTCSRFPSGDGPDAVRFTISRDDGATLRIYYVVERDHHPFSHGPLEYSLACGGFVEAPEGEIICRQARAYVESYLRRKMEAARWKP
jgi:hypothetical protein